MTAIKDRVSDIYWYDIIKNVLSESKTSLNTIEIWEKLRDLYAYSYDKKRLSQELLNLQRTGYAKSVVKNGKQAWIFPSSNELLNLEKNKTIDITIAELINTLDHVPTIEEVISRVQNEPFTKEQLRERFIKITKLTKSIDETVQQICFHNSKQFTEERLNIEKIDWTNTTCKTEIGETPFYETVIEKLDGSVEDIDILTVIHIINSRHKFLTHSQNK